MNCCDLSGNLRFQILKESNKLFLTLAVRGISKAANKFSAPFRSYSCSTRKGRSGFTESFSARPTLILHGHVLPNPLELLTFATNFLVHLAARQLFQPGYLKYVLACLIFMPPDKKIFLYFRPFFAVTCTKERKKFGCEGCSNRISQSSTHGKCWYSLQLRKRLGIRDTSLPKAVPTTSLVHRWGLGRQEGQGRQGRIIQEVFMLPNPMPNS